MPTSTLHQTAGIPWNLSVPVPSSPVPRGRSLRSSCEMRRSGSLPRIHAGAFGDNAGSIYDNSSRNSRPISPLPHAMPSRPMSAQSFYAGSTYVQSSYAPSTFSLWQQPPTRVHRNSYTTARTVGSAPIVEEKQQSRTFHLRQRSKSDAGSVRSFSTVRTTVDAPALLTTASSIIRAAAASTEPPPRPARSVSRLNYTRPRCSSEQSIYDDCNSFASDQSDDEDFSNEQQWDAQHNLGRLRRSAFNASQASLGARSAPAPIEERRTRSKRHATYRMSFSSDLAARAGVFSSPPQSSAAKIRAEYRAAQQQQTGSGSRVSMQSTRSSYGYSASMWSGEPKPVVRATCYEDWHTIEKSLQHARETLDKLTIQGVKVRPTNASLANSISGASSLDGQVKARRLANLFRKAPAPTVIKIASESLRNAKGFCFVPLNKKRTATAVLMAKLDDGTLSSPLFTTVEFPEGFSATQSVKRARRFSLGAKSAAMNADAQIKGIKSSSAAPSHSLLVFHDKATLDLFRKPDCLFRSPLQSVPGPLGRLSSTQQQHPFPSEQDAPKISTYAFDAKSGLAFVDRIELRGMLFRSASSLNEQFYRCPTANTLRPSDVLDAHYHTPVSARSLREGLQRAVEGTAQAASDADAALAAYANRPRSHKSSKKADVPASASPFAAGNHLSLSLPLPPLTFSNLLRAGSRPANIPTTPGSSSEESSIGGATFPALEASIRSRSSTGSSEPSSAGPPTPVTSPRFEYNVDPLRAEMVKSEAELLPCPVPVRLNASGAALGLIEPHERPSCVPSRTRPFQQQFAASKSSVFAPSPISSEIERERRSSSVYSVESGLSAVTEATEESATIALAAQAEQAFAPCRLDLDHLLASFKVQEAIRLAAKVTVPPTKPELPARSPLRNHFRSFKDTPFFGDNAATTTNVTDKRASSYGFF